MTEVIRVCSAAMAGTSIAGSTAMSLDLHPWVRDRILRLWELAQVDDSF